ncbi:MAG: PKD domain-containing protein [Bacteroidota bacterium]
MVISDTNLCEGATTVFSVNITGGNTPVLYSWDFGDGFLASTGTPGHTYTVPGTYQPTVTISFSGGATCSVTGATIRVFGKPVCKYVITSDDSLCFKGNQLCILDQSVPGVSAAPIKRRVFQLSNGYFKMDSFPYLPTLCYQNTTDVNGHLYSLVMEITDTNNCVSRLSKVDSVRLFPEIDLLFTTHFDPTCGDILTKLVNQSSTLRSNVKQFYWDFVDGQTNSTLWDSVTHLYAYPGPYVPRLVVKDWNNCVDSFIGSPAIKSIIRDSLIYNSEAMKQCFKGHFFTFATFNPGGIPYWKIYDNANNLLYQIDDKIYTDTIRFSTCGEYRIHLKVVFPDCVFETDTIVSVMGPRAIFQELGNSQTTLQNIVQCEIFDTVHFVSPFPYLSCNHMNGGKYHLWDFGDAFAPPCTTDTKNGLNIGMNCNYSLDSSFVKHKYKEGEESCYRASLYIKDSLTGCSHSETLSLSLSKPDAHPNPNSSPPRIGLHLPSLIEQCLFTEMRFEFSDVLPACSYEKAWINFDSACGKDMWVLVDSANLRFYEHDGYLTTCDSSGYVTMGLIIKNGKDRNGKDCYDTAWYHHILRLLPINANFAYNIINPCKPYIVDLVPDDSIQYNLKKVRWNRFSYSYYLEDTSRFFDPLLTFYTFGDTAAQYLGATDSIIHRKRFGFPRAGVHGLQVNMENNSQCSQLNSQTIALGFYKNFHPSTVLTCTHNPIVLKDTIRYYNINSFNLLSPVPFWNMPARAAANKEKIWWDIGDGKGFVHTGSHPVITYEKPGTYTVTMIVQDSMGCLDTLVRENLIRIVELAPRIGLLQSAYLCAPQIVKFKDLSLVTDSIGDTVPSGIDWVVSRLWDFGDGTVFSTLPDPAHNYTGNRVFTVTLMVTTGGGCVDTVQTQVELKGPKPSFEILDTMGCEPFQAIFINTTGKPLESWTWYYGDPANQTYTTTSDSNITFTYTKAGIYTIKVLGTDTVFNPNTGNTIICNSFFPDPLTNLPERKVYVLPTPPMDVVFKDSVCKNEPMELTATGDAVYKKLTWIFGDGDSTKTERPDTVTEHVFAKAGMYRFMLVPINSSGVECADTVLKNILVTEVQADFTIDSSKTPALEFINASTNGVRYEWNFGKPSAGSGNLSSAFNGTFYYGTDTGMYTVCLMAFNLEDCLDSICKDIRIVNAHVIIPNVFTPDNNDAKNDAFDIDIAGFTQYEIKIYNRWGTEVYSGDRDGIRNDGINWNGKDHNIGAECAAGTYYYVFTYKLITEKNTKTVHGTITLIR